MNYVQLGKTDLKVSDIGFGAWAIGGLGWGSTGEGDKDFIAALETAYDNGVNFYDTCDAYGNGHSEELIGKVFARKRDKIIIATKAGTNFRQPERSKNFTEKYLLDSLDESLSRLQTDYVDIFLLHVPGTAVIEQGEIFETLDKIKASGKSRYCGLAMWIQPDILLALKKAVIDMLECPYNILNRGNAEAVKLAGEMNIPVFTSEPLAGGILTGKYSAQKAFTDGDHRKGFWTDERFAQFGSAMELIRECVKPPFVSMAQLALAFNINQPEIYAVIPGAKRPAHVVANITASGMRIPGEDLAKLMSIEGFSY
jgi:aryl-alcohol dehydrogenase-like predicted oxidoreductase